MAGDRAGAVVSTRSVSAEPSPGQPTRPSTAGQFAIAAAAIAIFSTILPWGGSGQALDATLWKLTGWADLLLVVASLALIAVVRGGFASTPRLIIALLTLGAFCGHLSFTVIWVTSVTPASAVGPFVAIVALFCGALAAIGLAGGSTIAAARRPEIPPTDSTEWQSVALACLSGLSVAIFPLLPLVGSRIVDLLPTLSFALIASGLALVVLAISATSDGRASWCGWTLFAIAFVAAAALMISTELLKQGPRGGGLGVLFFFGAPLGTLAAILHGTAAHRWISLGAEAQRPPPPG